MLVGFKRFVESVVVRPWREGTDYEKWKQRLHKEVEDAAHDREMQLKVGKLLKKAANFARKMGLNVRSSKDRDGRVSSYYVTDPKGGGSDILDFRPVRISDHELPDNEQRRFTRSMHSKPPFKAQIIIDLAGYPGEREIYFKYENVNDFDEFDYSDSLIKKAIKVGVTGEGGDPDEI